MLFRSMVRLPQQSGLTDVDRDQSLMTQSSRWEEGRACPLCPGISDVHLLGDSECVVDFDSEVTDSALDLPMS